MTDPSEVSPVILMLPVLTTGGIFDFARRELKPVGESKVEKSLLSEKQAAALLGVSRITLLRARKAGKIGFYRVGARVLFSETSHIIPYLTACEQKARKE